VTDAYDIISQLANSATASRKSPLSVIYGAIPFLSQIVIRYKATSAYQAFRKGDGFLIFPV